MKYYANIIVGCDVFKAITEASNRDEAEETLISCLDSGDYNHIIRDREFICEEVTELKEHRINSVDTHELNRITSMEAQYIYYSKGLFARKDSLHDIEFFARYAVDGKSFKIGHGLLEQIGRRIYKKLYFEGFLPRIETTGETSTERFWEYYFAFQKLDIKLIDIAINKELAEIIQRKAN